jgi:hypothetical protein
MIGASTALTTVHCCLIGVLGGNFSPVILDAIGITNPVRYVSICTFVLVSK